MQMEQHLPYLEENPSHLILSNRYLLRIRLSLSLAKEYIIALHL